MTIPRHHAWYEDVSLSPFWPVFTPTPIDDAIIAHFIIITWLLYQYYYRHAYHIIFSFTIIISLFSIRYLPFSLRMLERGDMRYSCARDEEALMPWYSSTFICLRRHIVYDEYIYLYICLRASCRIYTTSPPTRSIKVSQQPMAIGNEPAILPQVIRERLLPWHISFTIPLFHYFTPTMPIRHHYAIFDISAHYATIIDAIPFHSDIISPFFAFHYSLHLPSSYHACQANIFRLSLIHIIIINHHYYYYYFIHIIICYWINFSRLFHFFAITLISPTAIIDIVAIIIIIHITRH